MSRTSFPASGFAWQPEPHAFSVTIDAATKGTSINRRILGSNVGWAFGGDNMLDHEGGFVPEMLEMARRLGPTILRYPGGTYSDVFHWEAPINEHVFSREMQPTLMNTQRFLELCEALSAEPLISVNVVTGTPQEAARWVARVNRQGMKSRLTGRSLPRVRFWEIGNEPYLKEQSRTDIDIRPDEFAHRVNRFIRAMRDVDSGIVIGIPLTSDTRGGIPVTPYPGFTRRVLAEVSERFDYAALHNAYMPFAHGRELSSFALYWGAAAGALTVQSDLHTMARLLEELRPTQRIPVAVTEYSALFSLGRGTTDNWVATPAGAIYLADVLRVFAIAPSLLLATYWSLSANWVFGAIHERGYPRPAYQVLRLMQETLHGEHIDAGVEVGTARVGRIGQVDAIDAMPLIEVLTTRSNGTLRLFTINKDPRREAVGRVVLERARPVQARMTLLSTRNVFDASDSPDALARSESSLSTENGVAVQMPPHSIALITIDLATS